MGGVNLHTKGKYKCILLIDDKEVDTFIAKRTMELHHFSDNIIIKQSCTEALKFLSEKFKNQNDFPDFIFLDLFMPVQSGYDFLDAYSKIPKRKKGKCKLIVLSVQINEDKVQNFLKNQDIYTLLQKPLTKGALNALTDLQNIQGKFVRKVMLKYY